LDDEKMNKLSENSERKLKVIENLVNQLEEDKNMFEQFLQINKSKLIPKVCDLIKFTKK
jgi:hypothetical protein